MNVRISLRIHFCLGSDRPAHHSRRPIYSTGEKYLKYRSPLLFVCTVPDAEVPCLRDHEVLLPAAALRHLPAAGDAQGRVLPHRLAEVPLPQPVDGVKVLTVLLGDLPDLDVVADELQQRHDVLFGRRALLLLRLRRRLLQLLVRGVEGGGATAGDNNDMSATWARGDGPATSRGEEARLELKPNSITEIHKH